VAPRKIWQGPISLPPPSSESSLIAGPLFTGVQSAPLMSAEWSLISRSSVYQYPIRLAVGWASSQGLWGRGLNFLKAKFYHFFMKFYLFHEVSQNRMSLQVLKSPSKYFSTHRYQTYIHTVKDVWNVIILANTYCLKLYRACKTSLRKEAHVWWNSKRWLLFIVCQPRKTNYRFLFFVCRKQTKVCHFSFSFAANKWKLRFSDSSIF
jgi:hypothetical protein